MINEYGIEEWNTKPKTYYFADQTKEIEIINSIGKELKYIAEKIHLYGKILEEYKKEDNNDNKCK